MQLFLGTEHLLSSSLSLSSWLHKSVGCLKYVGVALLMLCVSDPKMPDSLFFSVFFFLLKNIFLHQSENHYDIKVRYFIV